MSAAFASGTGAAITIHAVERREPAPGDTQAAAVAQEIERSRVSLREGNARTREARDASGAKGLHPRIQHARNCNAADAILHAAGAITTGEA